jgi:hypothetical protein
MGLAVVVAAVGLTIEQQPPTRNAYNSTSPNAGADVPTGAGKNGGGTVTNSGGPEGADRQLPTGSRPTEVGSIKVPKNFRATTASVTQIFNGAFSGRGRAGLNVNQLVSASCSNGSCVVKYVPDGPGAGRIIEGQGPIWGALLKDPTWQSATLIAETGGPDIRGRGGSGGGPPPGRGGGPPAVQISCTRAAVAAVGVWGIQSAPRIKQLCRTSLTENKGA